MAPGEPPIKLAPDLFDTYKAYKRTTFHVIKWFSANGIPVTDLTSVQNLKQAAKTLKARGVGVTRQFYWDLKDTIKNRGTINQWFRHATIGKDDEAIRKLNESHEFIQNAFKQIFVILFPTGKQPGTQPKVQMTSKGNTKPKASKSSNKFADLENVAPETVTELPEVDDLRIGTPAPKEPTEEARPLSVVRRDEEEDDTPDTFFELDELPVFIILYKFAVEFEEICDRIKQAWEEAATGGMPIVFAAWLSIAAYKLVERMTAFFRLKPDLYVMSHIDFIDIFDKYSAAMQADAVLRSRKGLPYKVFIGGQGIFTPFNILCDLKEKKVIQSGFLEKKADQTLVLSEIYSLNNKAIQMDQSKSVRIEEMALETMSSSMARSVKTHEDVYQGTLSMAMNPLVAELEEFFESEDEVPDTSLVVGLQFQLEIFKSYLWPNARTERAVIASRGGPCPCGSGRKFKKCCGKEKLLEEAGKATEGGTEVAYEEVEAPATPMKCRLQALKFAREVQEALQKVTRHSSLKCDCSRCNGGPSMPALTLLERGLDTYLADDCVDIYHQSPWTAGSQMLEILNFSTDVGVQLCNEQAFVGAVLHLYNMLRELRIIKKDIEIFEKLSEVLLDAVFMGRRPTRNYYSIFIRFQGGRLSKGRIAEPEYAPSAGDDDRRIVAEDLSTFHKFSMIDYDPKASFWARIYGVKPSQQEFARLKRRVAKDTQHPAQILDMWNTGVLPEFQGAFPVARINWFAVYHTCVIVLEQFTTRARETGLQTPGRDPEHVEDMAVTGVQVVQMLLRCVSDSEGDKAFMRMLRELEGKATVAQQANGMEPLIVAREALMEAVEGKTVQDFLWDL